MEEKTYLSADGLVKLVENINKIANRLQSSITKLEGRIEVLEKKVKDLSEDYSAVGTFSV